MDKFTKITTTVKLDDTDFGEIFFSAYNILHNSPQTREQLLQHQFMWSIILETVVLPGYRMSQKEALMAIDLVFEQTNKLTLIQFVI